MVFVAYKGRKREKGHASVLGRVISVIFNITDLQKSRRCRDYRYNNVFNKNLEC